MAYSVHDDAKDAALQYLIDNADKVVVCDGAPPTFADSQTNNGTASGVRLGEAAVIPGDFTIADGAVDGRKVTLAAKSGVSLVAAGDADHVAWIDTTNSKLLFVTEIPTPRTGLLATDSVDIPEHFHAYRDAVQAT